MKTALITGSTSGIGKQIGIDLLDNDYFVYFNGRNQESIDKLEKEIAYKDCDSDYLPTFKIWQADLSHIINVLDLSFITKIDVLILNAGTTDRSSFGKIKLQGWNSILNTNLTIPFFLIQQLKDKINDNGHIIFISSILAEKPHSRSISYAVSKAGVNALVKNLVKEFAHKNITVNAIAPGFIETKWHDGKNKAQLDRIKKRIALKRFGTTAEVSSLVQEVIRNPYINGQILTIDGAYDYE